MIRFVADPTPEVLNALVRLVNGDYDLTDRPKDELYALAAALINAKATLAKTLSAIHGHGDTFAEIGDQLGIHEATASRWAKPPAEDLRRRRRGERPGG